MAVRMENDDKIGPIWHKMPDRWVYKAGIGRPDGWGSYRTTHWPRGDSILGDFGDVQPLQPLRWSDPEMESGSQTRMGVVGVTRDVYGSPLGGVTVRLFRTSDNVLVDTIVSDPSGNYLLGTPYYPDTHYVVAQKSGSPDVQGVTVNTLIGA